MRAGVSGPRRRRLWTGAAAALTLAVALDASSAYAQAPQTTGTQPEVQAQEQTTAQEPPEGGTQQTPDPVRVTESVVVVGGVRAASPIDTLGAVSSVSVNSLDNMQVNGTSQLFRAVPGMSASPLGDDKGTVINIRGMQDNGRVQVVVDGARQDFSRPSHAGYGTFYLDPDLLSTVTVVRGPGAGASGGIGGFVNLQTLRPVDLLRGDERIAVRQKVGYDTNGAAPVSSTTAAVRLGRTFSVLANLVARRNADYTDGAGRRILYTEERPQSTLFKGVLTPNDHHMVTVGYTGYRNDFLTSRQAGSSSPTLSVDNAEASNDSVSGQWFYANPANRAVEFVVGAYNTRTNQDQVKVKGTLPTIGQTRGYTMKTSGFNVSNVSRARGFGMNHALTVGADYLHDTGSSTDIANGNGTRSATGVFAQWEGDYRRLQLIASLRRDAYEVSGREVNGAQASNSRSRTLPRFTAGVTALPGVTVYGTYVEGFRPPAIYEIFGIYASASVYRLGLDLLPEEARDVEGGVNFKKRGLFAEGSAFDVKFNVYNTRVDNFITGRSVAGVFQFNNIGAARLKGSEIDASYSDDWGSLSFAGSFGSATREGGQFDGTQLSNAPLNRITATVGLNAVERKLHYGAMFMHIDSKARNTSAFPTAPLAPAYSITYLFASYTVNAWLDARFNADNLFNRSFDDPTAQYATTGPTSFQGRGRTLRFTLVGRFGR